MADEILYEQPEIITSNERGPEKPDPLGLRKQLAQKNIKPDPLGLRAKLSTVTPPVSGSLTTTPQPKDNGIPIYDPNFKPPVPNTKEGYVLPKLPPLIDKQKEFQKVVSNTSKANANIADVINTTGDDFVRKRLADAQVDKRLQERLSQFYPVNNSELPPLPIVFPASVRKAERDKLLPTFTPDQVAQSLNDKTTQRKVVEKQIRTLQKDGKDKDANKLMADLYVSSATDANEDNAFAINRNAEEIRRGNYQFIDGKLIKPQGVLEAIKTGFDERNKSYDLGHDLLVGSKDNNIKLLNSRLGEIQEKNDPHYAVPTPVGVGGTVGHFAGAEGISTIKSTVPNLIPVAGSAAAIALTAEEMGMRSYGDKTLQVYGEQKQKLAEQHPDWSEKQIDEAAYDIAEKSGKAAGWADAAVAALLTKGVGGAGKLPKGARIWSKEGLEAGRSIPKASISTFKKVAQGSKEFLGNTIKTGIPVAGAAGAAQVGKNLYDISLGIDKRWDEGVAESMKGMLILHGVFHSVGAAAKLGKSGLKSLYQAFTKMRPEDVQQIGNNLVHDKILSRYEADQIVADIENHRQQDLQIPAHITDTDQRLKIHNKIDEYNELNQQIKPNDKGQGGLHPAYGTVVKEKIKKLEDDIHILSQTPEEQIRLLTNKAKELERQLNEDKTARQEGGKPKLEDRELVKRDLSEVNKSLKEVTEKVNSDDYKSGKILDEYYDQLPESMRYGAKESPHLYLQELARQSQGIDAEGKPLAGGGTREALLSYGVPEKLINKAEEMFPAPKPEPSKISVIRPQEMPKNETITIAPKEEAVGKTENILEPINTEIPQKSVDLPKIKQDAADITTGKKVFERFSQEEQRGLTAGGRPNVEATLLLAADERAGKENNSEPAAQENRIEQYAKDNNLWTDNTTQELTKKYGEPIAAGEEAIVWGDPKNGKVIKTQDTFQYENLQQKLDGITLHNTYFPEAPIKVLGFGKNSKGEFQIIVEQPFIKGEKLTPEEIHNYLESIGFKQNENGHYSNRETIVEDVHTGNAIRTPEGNIIVIDPIMRLNTPEQGYGGTRIVNNKISDHAVSQRSPEEISMGKTSNNSGKVGEGISQPKESTGESPSKESEGKGTQGEVGGEPPITPPKAESVVSGEYIIGTNIKHKTLEEDAADKGLKELADHTRVSFEELRDKADNLIKEGATSDIIKRALNDEGINSAEKAVLVKAKATVDKELEASSNELAEANLSGDQAQIDEISAKNEMLRNQAYEIYSAAKKAGSKAGLDLASQKLNMTSEYSLGEMLNRKREAAGGEPLTKEQSAKIEIQSKEITAKERKIKEKGKELADKIRALRINKGDRAQANLFGIPVAIYDGAVVTIANAVEQGANLADAIKRGIDYVKENGGFKDAKEERKFSNHIKYGGMQESRLAAYKKRTQAAIGKLRSKISNKEFEKQEIPPIELDKEALDLRAELADTKHEFDLEVLKDEMAKRSWSEKHISTNIRKTIGTVKAITSGIDDSAVMIQNYLAILANPKMGVSALKEHALDALSQKRFDRQLAALHNSPYWELIKDSGVEVLEPTSLNEALKEELMANSFHNEKINIKIKGKDRNVNPAQVLKPFERAFTSLGNNLRVKMFLQQAEKLLDEGKTFKTHPEEFKALARVVNSTTGRGKQNKYVELANPVVTAFIWSPKLLSSGFDALGITDLVSLVPGAKRLGTEGYYRKLTPRQRKYALMQVGKGLGVGISVMAAAGFAKKMGADVDVDYDPRSVTFGNITSGNKSVNVFGRFSSIAKVLVQSVTGERVKGEKVEDLNSGKYGKKNVGGVIGSFARGKMTPIGGLTWDFVTNSRRHYFTGEEMTMLNSLKQLAPISLQGLATGLERDGSLYLLNDFLPNFVGVKVSDQRDFKKKSKGGSHGRPQAPRAPQAPRRPE